MIVLIPKENLSPLLLTPFSGDNSLISSSNLDKIHHCLPNYSVFSSPKIPLESEDRLVQSAPITNKLMNFPHLQSVQGSRDTQPNSS